MAQVNPVVAAFGESIDPDEPETQAETQAETTEEVAEAVEVEADTEIESVEEAEEEEAEELPNQVPVAALVAERKKRQEAEAKLAEALKLKAPEPKPEFKVELPDIPEDEWLLNPQSATQKLVEARIAAEVARIRAEAEAKDRLQNRFAEQNAQARRDFPDYDQVVTQDFLQIAQDLGLQDRALQTQDPYRALYAMAKRLNPTPVEPPSRPAPPSKPKSIANEPAVGSGVKTLSSPNITDAFAAVMSRYQKSRK